MDELSIDPSRPLKNSRQEKYVQLLFKGAIQHDAYLTVFKDTFTKELAPATIDSKASRLANSGKVQNRLNFLKTKAEDESVMKVLERKQKLSTIGRAKLTDYVDNNGNVDITGEGGGAIAELTIEDWKGGKDGRASSQIKRIKLLNPIQAIEELNKMDGVYDARPEAPKYYIGQVNINANGHDPSTPFMRLVDGTGNKT